MSEDLDLLAVPVVAELLKVTPRWVYRAVAREELPYVRVGKFIRFRRSEIEAYVEARSHGSA